MARKFIEPKRRSLERHPPKKNPVQPAQPKVPPKIEEQPRPPTASVQRLQEEAKERLKAERRQAKEKTKMAKINESRPRLATPVRAAKPPRTPRHLLRPTLRDKHNPPKFIEHTSSSFDVVVYLSSINMKFIRKKSTLESFAKGAKKLGLKVEIVYERRHLVKSRLAVILGWHSPYSKSSINNTIRKAIIEFQNKNNDHTMAIDAGCWKFCDPNNEYLRYSLGGVYYDQSNYANKNSTPEKFEELKTKLNLDMKPWTKEGDHILLLVQRDGGWSMKGLKPIDWVRTKIMEIRKYSNRKIKVRPHPGGTKENELAELERIPGIEVTDPKRVSIQEDLRNCYAALVFNSSSGVAAIMEGVPLFVDDRSSVCYDVANIDISSINTPQYPDREQWAYDLAACHWNDQQAAEGLIYKKFEEFLKP